MRGNLISKLYNYGINDVEAYKMVNGKDQREYNNILVN